jgi:Fic family protein
MIWNWEQSEWPEFAYGGAALDALERQFLVHTGEFAGVVRHIGTAEQDFLKVELIGDEALKTSEIEGEILNRDSVQSSLRDQFGLARDADARSVAPAERGIAEMMVDLYRTYEAPLTHEMMFGWHRMVMAAERHLRVIGGYRTHSEPMQVVSGAAGKPKIHFEAPPSSRMTDEMEAFVRWFNNSGPNARTPFPTLTRAGLAHLYFESLHPFEDGNGRIGRALAEKSLAQNLGRPTLIALSYTIERTRKAYYAAFERNQRELEVTDWLVYFAETVIEAQRNTIRRVEFLIARAKLYERLRGRLNPRQDKIIARMFREGLEGFKGGLSAENYISIAKTSRATATRDLQNLVALGALTRTGELRHTRYHLNVSAEGRGSA